MIIAITGCLGVVARDLLPLVKAEGHTIIGVDRVREPKNWDTSLGEYRYADLCNFDETFAALQGAEAVIHMGAIPNPNGIPPHVVHNNNVTGSFNVLQACADLGIRRLSQMSSVNAPGLQYGSTPPRFDYFPLDEKHPFYPDDAYALSKQICEVQADTFCRSHPNLRVASFRLHATRRRTDLELLPEGEVRQGAYVLWTYTDPVSAGEAILASVTKDVPEWKGHEVFYCVSPTNEHHIYQGGEPISTSALADKHHANVPRRADLDKVGFFDCSKLERMLGWKHADHP